MIYVGNRRHDVIREHLMAEHDLVERVSNPFHITPCENYRVHVAKTNTLLSKDA